MTTVRSSLSSTSSRWETLLAVTCTAAAVAVVSIAFVTSRVSGHVLRDPFDLFDLATNTPVMLVLPLVASLSGAAGFIARLRFRAAANWWSRSDMRASFLSSALRAGLITWVCFTIAYFVVFWWCTSVLPATEAVNFSAESYSLSSGNATNSLAERATFGGLAQVSPWAFGGAWAAFIGFQCGLYCLLTIGLATLTDRPRLALFLPFIFVHAESLAASLAGSPTMSLVYLQAPSALAPAPTWVPLSLAACLALVVGLAVLVPGSRPTRFRALQ